MSVRSSVFVTQFEGEGHGNELGIAVPHELRARRVTGAPEPSAEVCDQTDGVAEGSGGGSSRERAKVASTRSSPSQNSSSLGSSGTSRPSRTINWMRQPTAILMAMARSRRLAVWCCNSSTLHPDSRMRK